MSIMFKVQVHIHASEAQKATHLRLLSKNAGQCHIAHLPLSHADFLFPYASHMYLMYHAASMRHR